MKTACLTQVLPLSVSKAVGHTFQLPVKMNSCILFIVSTFCVAVFSATTKDCPKHLKRDRYLKVYGDYCYQFEVDRTKEYSDAEAFCQENGGHLALLKTEKIHKFITNQLRLDYLLGYNPVWIGLRYDTTQGRYLWEDKTEMTFSNFVNPDQPKSRACVDVIPYHGEWRHTSCKDSELGTAHKRFVCQYGIVTTSVTTTSKPTTKGVESTTTTTTTTTLPPETTEKTTKVPGKKNITIEDCPQTPEGTDNLRVFGNKCLRFEAERFLEFENAEKYCQEMGGHLVKVESEELNNFLRKVLEDTFDLHYREVWIGLRYQQSQNAFLWTDKTGLTYSNLDTRKKSGDCVALKPSTGKWMRLPCVSSFFHSVDLRFVCEYQPLTSSPAI